MQETKEMWVRSLGQEDPLEEEMATHSSILAWRIPWTEELDWLQSIGLQRVIHNWSDLVCTHALHLVDLDCFLLERCNYLKTWPVYLNIPVYLQDSVKFGWKVTLQREQPLAGQTCKCADLAKLSNCEENSYATADILLYSRVVPHQWPGQ